MVELPAGFDEATYLELHPDVAVAVAQGRFVSAAQFHQLLGHADRRALRRDLRPPPLSFPFPKDVAVHRRDRILAGLDLSNTKGVEIGPLSSPLVSKAEGEIYYVDYADAEHSRQKYATDPNVKIEDIVEIDGIWGAQSLSECMGAESTFDYVVASHVVEHVPDLVTWLSEIKTILSPTGSLRLAVPDRRFTFDHMRPESEIYDVLSAYVERRRTPAPRTVLEFHTLKRSVDCQDAWRRDFSRAGMQFSSDVRTGLHSARDTVETGAYHDVHCWVFTPASFLSLMLELSELDLLEFACERFLSTARDDMEFFVDMAPHADRRVRSESWRAAQRLLIDAPDPQPRANFWNLMRFGMRESAPSRRFLSSS